MIKSGSREQGREVATSSRLDLLEPNIVVRHIVMVSDGRFSANWHINGGPAGGYYEG